MYKIYGLRLVHKMFAALTEAELNREKTCAACAFVVEHYAYGLYHLICFECL